MLIDCDSCTAGPRACGDCIVTHLLQVGPARGSTVDPWTDSREPSAELTDSEVAAVAVLSAGGLVPPLRLVTSSRPAAPAPTGAPGRAGRRPGRSRTG